MAVPDYRFDPREFRLHAGIHLRPRRVEQPLREAEFDDVFRTAVRAVERIDATRVRLDLIEEASLRRRRSRAGWRS